MTYATEQHMIDRFGEGELIELTDRADPPAEAVDTAILDQALTAADEVIDAHLRERYTVPVSPAPTLLVDIAADLARYRLHDDDAPDMVKDRHAEALRKLKALARGEITIDAPAAAKPAAGGDVRTKGPDRVFTHDTLEGF